MRDRDDTLANFTGANAWGTVAHGYVQGWPVRQLDKQRSNCHNTER